MVAAGDSLSAAFIAQTAVMDSESDRFTTRSVSDTTDNRLFETKRGSPFVFKIASLEDHKKSYSWSSGRRLEPHFERLKEWLKKSDPKAELHIQNTAMPGARTLELDHQADLILSRWRKGHFTAIKYLTLTVGANDLCDGAFLEKNKGPAAIEKIRQFFLKLLRFNKKNRFAF